jgi:hypothetical protein
LFSSIGYHLGANPETLIAKALSHFDHIDDTDLKCMPCASVGIVCWTYMLFLGRFYDTQIHYYLGHKYDISKSLAIAKNFLSLAVSTDNIKRQSQALCRLSWMEQQLGDYPAAQAHACESHRLGRIYGILYQEVTGLQLEADCWTDLGNYKHTVSLCTRARDLLALCGLSGGDLDHVTMGSLAEAQMCKSEYEDARNIRTQILRESPVEQDILYIVMRQF